MDKFLQQFKENLENQPPPSFDRQDWEDMQKRLQSLQANPQSAWSYWPWLAIVLLICSIGFNWFTYNQLKEVSKSLSALQQGRDSILHTTTVFQTDTIYQSFTVYKEVNATAVPGFKVAPHTHNLDAYAIADTRSFLYRFPFLNPGGMTNVSSFYSDLWNQALQGNAPVNSSQIAFSTHDQISLLTSSAPTATIRLLTEPVSTIARLPLSGVASLEKPIPLFKVPEITEQTKKSLGQRLYPLRPKGAAIGVSMGGGTTLSNNYNDLHTFNRGLAGKVNFSDALRLSIDVGLSTLGYESGQMGDQYGVPVITFPNDDYELQEIRVNRKLWSATIGMEYSFLTQKKWHPFVGIGFGASSLIKNKVDYVFEDETTDEYVTDERTYEDASNLQYTRFDAGIAYRVGKKWNLQLTIDYLYRLQNLNNQLPSNVHISLKGLYDF